MAAFRRNDVCAALALAALALISWAPRLRGPIDLRWDAGAYYVLGTALAEGKGYRLLNEPGEIPTTLHPPLLPAIVALHQLMLGTDDVVVVGSWLRTTYVAIFVAYAFAIYFLLRTYLPATLAFLAALISLANFHTIFLSDLCFAEIPFGLVTFLFLISSSKRNGILAELGNGLLGAAAYLLRTVGVALLAAWVAQAIWEGRFKLAALRMLLSAVPILSWTAYVHHVEASPEYVTPAYEYQRADYTYINVSYARNISLKDPFTPELGYASTADLVGRFGGNLALLPETLGQALSTKKSVWHLIREAASERFIRLPEWIVTFTLWLLGALVLLGLTLHGLRRDVVVPLYVVFYLSAVCSTPWPGQFNRYLVPLTPLLSLSLFLSFRVIRERVGALSVYAVAGLLCLILGSQIAALIALYTRWHEPVSIVPKSGEPVPYRLFFFGDYRAMDSGLEWVRERAAPRDVIAATDPQWAYLRTGMKAVLPPFEVDAAKAQRLVDSVPIRYLMVDEKSYRKYTAQIVGANPRDWRLAFGEPAVVNGHTGAFAIYERTAEERSQRE